MAPCASRTGISRSISANNLDCCICYKQGPADLRRGLFYSASLDSHRFPDRLEDITLNAEDDVCRTEGHQSTALSTKENAMDGKELKKVLASLGIATLVTAVGATVPGHLQAGSG